MPYLQLDAKRSVPVGGEEPGLRSFFYPKRMQA